MIMSFSRSIGNLIQRSVIKNLFIEVHAENIVNHIMSEKTVSRALCAHFITEAILVTLLKQVFDNEMIETKHFNGQLTEAL